MPESSGHIDSWGARRSPLKNDRWREWAAEDHQTDRRKGLPAPLSQKPFPPEAELIDLVSPADFRLGDAPLREVMAARRSRRRYLEAPLSLEELSFLLWASQGVRRVAEVSSGRRLTGRTVPSGGAAHPFETYLCVDRVEGLAPGLYRYLPIEHQLLFLRSADGLMDEVLGANCGNEFVKRCAVFFIWTALPYRMEYTYDVVAAKIIALDAGHVCQNLYLAGEAVGVGVCAIDGYFQAEMDNIVGVDGDDELAVYAAAVGKIRTSEAGSTGPHFAGSSLAAGVFGDMDMSGTQFDNVNLAGTQFNNVNLAATRLSDVNLAGMEITDCNVEGMTIDGISVQDALTAYLARKGSPE